MNSPALNQYQPTTVTILDPGMLMQFGHHFTYNQLMLSGLSKHGYRVGFLLHKNLPQQLRQLFPQANCVLKTNLYAEAHINAAPVAELMRYATLFAAELECCICLGPNRLLFAHTLDPLRLSGIALWYSKLPPHKKIPLALNVMLGIGDEAMARAALKPAARLFASEENVRLFGATRGIAKILSDLSGKLCPMLPTPLPNAATSTQALTKPAEQDSGMPLFGITGDARRGKNLHLLPAAIMKYLHRGGKGNFLLQLTPSEVDAHPEVIALHELCTMFPERITLSLDRLTEDNYYAQLSSLSAVLLPYSPAAYNAYRPSGPAIEAAALGVPVISCAGGFIEGELAPLNNGSIFIERESPDELAEALFTFEREAEARKQQAKAAAVSYRRFHSMENIIGMIGLDPEQG